MYLFYRYSVVSRKIVLFYLNFPEEYGIFSFELISRLGETPIGANSSPRLIDTEARRHRERLGLETPVVYAEKYDS